MKKSELLRALQTEIQKHNLSTFKGTLDHSTRYMPEGILFDVLSNIQNRVTHKLQTKQDQPYTAGFKTDGEECLLTFPFIGHLWSRGVTRWIRFSLSVADSFVCRCLTSCTMLPSSHPAHRTGCADFPLPALGERVTMSPTGNCASAW
jgi:hypothetical protein